MGRGFAVRLVALGALGVLLLPVAALLSCCSGQDSGAQDAGADTSEVSAETLLMVPGAPPGSTVVDGLVDAYQYVDVSFARSGVILELAVRVGDSVRRGQFLGMLETRDLKVQLRDARAQRRVARRALPVSRLSRNGPPPAYVENAARQRQAWLKPSVDRQDADLRRLQRAVEEGGQKEATAMAIAILQARSSKPSTKTAERLSRERQNQRLYDDLNDKVARLEDVVDASRLLSPADGEVVAVNAFVGENWNRRSQRAAFRLMDDRRLVVWALVPEAVAALQFRDAPVWVLLPPAEAGAGGSVVRATVSVVTAMQVETELDDGSIEMLRKVRIDLPAQLPGAVDLGDEALVAFPP